MTLLVCASNWKYSNHLPWLIYSAQSTRLANTMCMLHFCWYFYKTIWHCCFYYMYTVGIVIWLRRMSRGVYNLRHCNAFSWHLSQIPNCVLIMAYGLYHHGNDRYSSSEHQTWLTLNWEQHTCSVLSPLPIYYMNISLAEIVEKCCCWS